LLLLRLTALLLTVGDVRAWLREAAGVCVLLEATSTVRFTGRAGVAVLREERLETAGWVGGEAEERL
jgi:hypothetical protein